MIQTYFARITDILPSRVVTIIPSDSGKAPLTRTFDSTPMVGIIDLRVGTVFQITIETNPGEVIIRYAPANKNDYCE